VIAQTWQVLRKELLIEWRDRSRVSGVFFFALAILLMVAFATPQSTVLPKIAGGTLWLGLMLASTRSLDQSYAVEHRHGAMEGLLLWPVEPAAIYYGKALANAMILTLVAVVLLPLLIAVYGAEVKGDVLQLLAVVALGCAALAAPGTLYGLITSQARGSSVLLPLLLFPLVVPAILAASNATTKIMEGDPMEQAPAWIGVIFAFDCVHWSIMGLVYGRILED
jgi:heme exporter protein B